MAEEDILDIKLNKHYMEKAIYKEYNGSITQILKKPFLL